MKKLYILFTLMLFTTLIYAQTNLIDTAGSWTKNLIWTGMDNSSLDDIVITGENVEFITSGNQQWVNTSVYRSIDLVAGITYVMDFDLNFSGISNSFGELYLSSYEPGLNENIVAGTNMSGTVEWIEEVYNTWDCNGGTQNNSAITSFNNAPIDKASTYVALADHSGVSCDTSTTAGDLTFSVTTTGTYYIIFKTGCGWPDMNNPSSLGSISITIDNMEVYDESTLGITEFSSNDVASIVTSSNPVLSAIELRASGEYSIVNIIGQKVQSGNFDGSVNVETLKTGIYFLSIKEGIYKFVKQ